MVEFNFNIVAAYGNIKSRLHVATIEIGQLPEIIRMFHSVPANPFRFTGNEKNRNSVASGSGYWSYLQDHIFENRCLRKT